jgi:hypothetical protein
VGGREGSRGLTSGQLEASIGVRNGGLLSAAAKAAAMDDQEERPLANTALRNPRFADSRAGSAVCSLRQLFTQTRFDRRCAEASLGSSGTWSLRSECRDKATVRWAEPGHRPATR